MGAIELQGTRAVIPFYLAVSCNWDRESFLFGGPVDDDDMRYPARGVRVGQNKRAKGLREIEIYKMDSFVLITFSLCFSERCGLHRTKLK